MTIERVDDAREKGIALVYVGIFLVPILLCTGLAIDLGRGYLVRVALAKAVDAAALAAARNITADSATATAVANNIFNANFPPGFLGVSSLRNPPGLKFDIGSDGSHIITVSSTATLPTTFMRMAKFDTLTVSADATATRRLVDMSFVIDRSGSLLGAFPAVQAAAMEFVGKFDPEADRIALITFSSGTTLAEPMGSARGFDLAQIDADIAATKANGETATAEALYEAWDQLRAVPYGSQSGLRIVVLFTDGTPNSFPGKFQVMSPVPSGCSTSLWPLNPVFGTIGTSDYPKVPGNSSTTQYPDDKGLFDTYATGVTCVSPTDNRCGAYHSGVNGGLHKQNPCIPYLPNPLQSYHASHVSGGIPTSFPLWLPGQRSLDDPLPGGYPNNWWSANNAARNLAETIANAIRSDTDGLNRIRIYTLGLGDLLLAGTGSRLETGASILKRIANDPTSPDHNPDQLDGQFFYADKPDQLSLAFSKVHDEIFRLSQ